MLRLFLFFACALVLGGCVTPAKTYHAPDFKKVDAAAKRLSVAHGKIAATTERMESKAVAAQKNADTIAGHSANIIGLVDKLALLATPEMQPLFAELKTAVNAEQTETGELVTNLGGVRREIDQLKMTDIPEAAAAKAESDAAIATVKTESKKTADAATSESARRYKAESQNLQQKIWRWAWRIGGGLIVIGIIVLLVTGKLSWKIIRSYFHF